MADPATYTKGDWSALTPAEMRSKLENIEHGIKANNDALVAETDAGRAITQAANAAAQRALLNVEDGADVTDAGNVGASIHGAAAKTTPVDADTLAGINSESSNVLTKFTFANIWAWIQGKIHGSTAKATPADADTIPYTDTEASNVVKKMSFAQLWTWVQGKIHGALNKDALVDADKIGIVDTEASNVVKTTTWSNVKAKIWTALGALIAGGTAKATPLDADKFGYSSAADSNATRYVLWSSIKSVLATAFKHGGSNEIATATPGPNVIPKAGADNKLAAGFLPAATTGAVGGVQLAADGNTDAGKAVQGNDSRLTGPKVSFTPTILIGGASTGIVYTEQVGISIRTRDGVLVRGRVAISSKGALTGNVNIGGFPVACGANGTPLTIVDTSVNNKLRLSMAGGTNEAELSLDGTGAYTRATDAALTNTTIIRFSGFYSL